MTKQIPDSIANLAARGPDLAATLSAWASQNSGSGNPAGLAAMRTLLAEAFRSFSGASVEEPALPGTEARALLVRMRPDKPVRVLCSGHYDTVYAADHPFQACTWLPDGRLNGPGVADMKGGIVVMLAALQAFEQTPGAASLGWDVLLTPDEETGSAASSALIAECAKRCRIGLVFEPARGNGDLVRSRMATGVFTVTCRGRAAHAARMPNNGRNAIVALSEFLVAADQIPTRLPGTLVNIGAVRGGGVVNIVPDFAEALLNIRVSRVADQAAVAAALEEAAASIRAREGYSLEIAGAFDRPPKECGPVEEALFAAWRGASADLGLPPFSWQHAGGGSDGNLLSAAGLPNLDGLGVVGDQLHSDREYCEPSTLAARAQIAALVLHRYAQTGLDGVPRG